MDNQCGITRNLKQYEPWPKVISPALKPVEIPFLTPEERGDSQPYPVSYPIDPKPYYKPSDWMGAEGNEDANYVWPGPVQVW